MEHGDAMSKSSLIQEQLITLWAFHKSSLAADKFEVFLQDLGRNSFFVNESSFKHICYFLLGLIDREERDKLIVWPISNIQREVKFRKGVAAMVKDLTEKYPKFNLQALHKSHLMDPYGNQKKILNFVIRLSNLAVYLAVRDPLTLIMGKRDGLSVDEFETAARVVRKAAANEEKIIRENIFPVDGFDESMRCMINKCVELKKENSHLESQLSRIKRKLVQKGIISKESEFGIEDLRKKKEERFEELARMLDELRSYDDAGKDVLSKVKSAANPVSLEAQDLGLGDARERCNVEGATSRACDRLNCMFENMKAKEMSLGRQAHDVAMLRKVKEAMRKENECLLSFIGKRSRER